MYHLDHSYGTRNIGALSTVNPTPPSKRPMRARVATAVYALSSIELIAHRWPVGGESSISMIHCAARVETFTSWLMIQKGLF